MVQIADRSITIRIGANVTGLMAGLRTAQTAAKDFTGRTLDGVQRNSQAISTLSRSVGVVGLGLTALAAVAVRSFANFDAAMSNVEATGDDARDSLDELRAAALKAGADTVFSATEAAGAVTSLAKAGVSASDILAGGLTGSLNLAAAGQLAVAEAAEITATAMNQFGLEGSDASHVADLLAAAANKAMGEVTDMAGALKFVGPVASQMGISIEETAGTIAYLAQQGVLGEQAGTSLRGMLTALTSPSKIASAEMEKLRISVYDASGEFVGFNGVAEQLRTKMGGLTNAERDQSLGRIFGNEQITTARLLYAGGAAEIDKWTAAVDDSGYAAEVAATKMNNLKGDLEQLRGSLETALIGMGEGANGPLRSLVQGLTAVVNKIGEMPAAAQGVSLALFGGGGLILLGVAGMGKLAVGISEAKIALEALKISGKTATLAVVGVTAGLALGALALGAWASAQAAAQARTEAFQATLDEFGKTTDETLSTINDTLSSNQNDWAEGLFGKDPESMIDQAKKYGLAIEDLQGYILGEADAVDRVNGATEEYYRSHGRLNTVSTEVQAFTGALDDQAGALTGAEKAALQKAVADEAAGVASEDAAGSVMELATAQQYVGQATEEATKALEDWRAMVAESDADFISLTDGYQAVIDKNTEWAQATADATESSDDSWQTYYDGVTVSAADFISQLQAQVDAQTAWETNMTALTTKAREGMTTEMARAADEMIADLMDLGPEGAAQVALMASMTDTEFQTVVTLWGQKGTTATDAFVSSVETHAAPVIELQVDTASAYSVIDTLRREAGRTIYVNAAGQTVGFSTGTGRTQGRAGGGDITGPGTSTSDSILVRASSGEHMLAAREVSALGGQAAVYRMRAAIRAGMLRGFRDGGAVQGYAGGGGVYAQRQYAGTPQWSGGPAGGATASARDLIDYNRLARAMANVQISLDGRAVGQSVDQRIGASIR